MNKASTNAAAGPRKGQGKGEGGLPVPVPGERGID